MNELSSEIITPREMETPVLQLDRAALALHAVVPLTRQERKALAQPAPPCPDFRAAELDLLSYGFQLASPLTSRREIQEAVPVRIRFPDRTMYQSGGRSILLPCPEPQREAEILVSSTTFPLSGLRVWHFVLKPRSGGSFTEFDLLKLIHLYDGRIQNTGLSDTILFDLEGGWAVKSAEGLPAGQLLARLGGAPPGKSWLPRAGTLEVLAPDDLALALDAAQKARSNKPAEEPRKTRAKASRESALLKACCGIVTGSFDFAELSAEEIQSILTPAVDSPRFIRFHRGTLASIVTADRAAEDCWQTVGVSPYLLIPHAVLLHNEALVERADATLEPVLGTARVRIGQLERARALVEESLQPDLVPNLFNGATERALFAKGWESRAGEERRNRALRRLERLRGRIETRWQRRRETGLTIVASLLTLVLALQAREVLFDALGPRLSTSWKWTILGLVALAIASILFLLSRIGLERDPAETSDSPRSRRAR